MLSSRLEFPKDELLTALRENYQKIDPFIKQTTKHNTYIFHPMQLMDLLINQTYSQRPNRQQGKPIYKT